MYPPRNKKPAPQAFTLVEMLMACAVMGILAMALGVLASTVGASQKIVNERAQAVQHARVVIDRIERSLHAAYASESFPGFIIIADSVGGYAFPDTLVVWRPSAAPADALGLPRFNEIVVYMPNPALPHEIWEITAPADTRVVPAVTNVNSWQSEMDTLCTSNSVSRVVLTDMLRKGEVSNAARGVLRFEANYAPTFSEWQQYKAGTLTWDDINWAQDRYGSTSGVGHAWCAIELSIAPEANLAVTDSRQLTSLPFFGSASITYQLKK